MGGILSKNTKEDQEKRNEILKELELSKTIAGTICKKSETKLNEIYENVAKIVEQNSQSEIFNIDVINEINRNYNEALTMVDCHNPSSSLYKTKIKTIYQTYLRNLAMFITNKLRDIDIELDSAIKDMEADENKDPMHYGAFINERMTLLNNGINNLERLQTFYEYRDNFILDLNRELISDRDKINKKFIGYIGLYDIYKKFILSKYYAIGIGPLDENNKQGLIVEQLEKIQEYFNIDTYKYLMKFSELVPILYPTWPINNDSNQRLEFTDINAFYQWVDKDRYFDVNKSDVQSRFAYLMSYYSDIVMKKTVPNNDTLTWFNYYETLFDKVEEMIRNKVIVNEKDLFDATKKIYKLLGINHWKSIKFYANVNIDTMDKNEHLYIPSNYPIFSPKLESLITVTYSYNKLIEIYGNKEKKGGQFFEDPNIFHYDDIFYKYWEDPVLIQVSQIGVDSNPTLNSDNKKQFARRLKFYEEVADNTFGWYAFVNNEPNMLSTVFNNKPVTYLELFKVFIFGKYDQVNSVPDNLDFKGRYDFMMNKVPKNSTRINNLNHSFVTNYETEFKNIDNYIDNESDLATYVDRTTKLIIFNLANPELNESPTDIASDNLIMYYNKDESAELNKKEQAETNNLFGFLSAAYLIGNLIKIPNTKIIFELTTNCFNPTEIKTRNPLYNFVNIVYLFNYSDYMTYSKDMGSIRIANLVSFVYLDTLVNNKNFALIIPLYPEYILNDNTYYNTINYNDYKSCLAISSILNNYAGSSNSDEIIFDNMLQRSTYYMKSNGTF